MVATSTMRTLATISVLAACWNSRAAAAPPLVGPPAETPPLISPQMEPDGRVLFRFKAPEAVRVALTGDVYEGLIDAPPAPPFSGDPAHWALPPAAVMTKGADGVWTGETIRSVRPGAFRYAFQVDSAPAVDPSNREVVADQRRVSSVLVVPGDFSEERDVPHGAVARVHYEARTYGPGVQRSVIVYTPPGYEKGGDESYPVLYLLHGGGDTAEGWEKVGRANLILDNLIAEGRAAPFIVVMLNGWTPKGPQKEMIDAARDPLDAEFVRDIVPMIQARYRVKADPAHRALSGLSMGGFQTLTLGIKEEAMFDYVLPMSTGWFTAADRQAFVAANGRKIADAGRRLKLFWWGYGRHDIARENGLAGMASLRQAGLNRIQTFETPYGHDWSSWRLMLYTYAPLLFRDAS